MSHSSTHQTPAVEAALAALAEDLAQPLQGDDLGRLAQLHEQCEVLVDAFKTPLDDAPAGLARDLVKTLEALILDEAEEAEAALRKVPETFAELQRLLQHALDGAPIAPPESAPSNEAETETTTPDVENLSDASPATESDAGADDTSAEVTRLRDAVGAVQRTDLPALAQLHTRGETLLAQLAEATDPAVAGVRLAVEAVVKVLAGVILDDVSDPEAALRLAPQVLDAAAAPTNSDAGAVLAQLDEAIHGTGSAPTPPPVADVDSEAERKQSAPAAQEPVRAANIHVDGYVAEPLTLDLDDIEGLQGFIDEANEHLQTIEAELLAVESNPSDADRINELFRPFHTIKGIAGFLNLRDINCLTHEIETILDQGRKGEVRLTSGHIDLVFESIDLLKAQIGAIATYITAPTGEPCPQPACGDMIVRLRRVAAGEAPRESANKASAAVADEPSEEANSQATARTEAVQDLSIRVDTAKLDALVDTVGELVIAQTMVNLSSAVDADDNLRRVVTQVTKIVRDVQETAMAMRMLPLAGTFQKMKRVVRDVSRKAGKDVELLLNGEDTELDKNVIQQISDPLVHMVRNAVDHGVESPGDREQAGKPRQGVLRLNAYYEGDNVVIEVKDDGRGLDPDRLRRKALERGAIGPDEVLTDQEAFALIMAPGFSTAEKLTDISGRGVGMDVVRRNIEELRGKLEIDSQPGQGSTFRIVLPLTLAIIDGMIIRCGDQRLVIPTILIEQSLRPDASHVTRVQGRGEMMMVRGSLAPLVQLGQLFGLSSYTDPDHALVVVAQAGGERIGIVIDELIGQQQIVIKTLGERFGHVEGVSGAAILGDGRVGLILEPAGLLSLHRKQAMPLFSDREPQSGVMADLTDEEAQLQPSQSTLADDDSFSEGDQE